MSSNDIRHVIIVGGGCFGLSTALYLLRPDHPSRRFTYKVTILERADTIPAPDAASSDLNKIVRSSYSDVFYTKLTKDAVEKWTGEEIWGDTFHQ